MRAKTIFITAGLVVVGMSLMAYQKVQTLIQIFDRMTIKPSGISGFVPGLVQIRFKLDFKITNPTNEAFSVTGASIARLKKIVAYYNGQYMGMAELNLEAIEIPARSFTVLKEIPFTVSTQNLLSNLLTATDLDLNKLTLLAGIEVLGKEYIIEG
jgi:hypothetical protein